VLICFVAVLQLKASQCDDDVSRSRDTGHLVSLTSGQFDTRQHQIRSKIVCDMLTSERDYVKLLRDVIEVINLANIPHLPA